MRDISRRRRSRTVLSSHRTTTRSSGWVLRARATDSGEDADTQNDQSDDGDVLRGHVERDHAPDDATDKYHCADEVDRE